MYLLITLVLFRNNQDKKVICAINKDDNCCHCTQCKSNWTMQEQLAIYETKPYNITKLFQEHYVKVSIIH